MEWQPIETAPKDGRKVILYFPPIPAQRSGRFGHEELYKVDSGIGGPFRFATHWMHLPPPPKDTS